MTGIKALFKNCIRVEENEGWLKPLRFTEKQFASYKPNETLFIRTHAPSGVCLDFTTSATHFSLDYRILNKVRNWASFDIYTDGVFEQTLELTDLESGSIRYEFVKQGQKRVTIYLPHLVEIEFSNIAMDATFEPTPDYAKRILCLGDSITQGMNAVRPSSSYPVLLSRFWDASLLNLGIGGDVFNSEHLDALPFEPDAIFIAYGTNDWGKEKPDLIESVRLYLSKLTSLFSCKKIYGLLPLWRADWKDTHACGSFADLNQALRDVYADYPVVTVLDGAKLVPNFPLYYGDEWVHPNDEGFLHYALNIIKEVKTI